MLNVDLVDDNDIGEEKNNGDGEGGEEPPHCFTGTWAWLESYLLNILVAW